LSAKQRVVWKDKWRYFVIDVVIDVVIDDDRAVASAAFDRPSVGGQFSFSPAAPLRINPPTSISRSSGAIHQFVLRSSDVSIYGRGHGRIWRADSNVERPTVNEIWLE
jgi:hypothetical protein